MATQRWGTLRHVFNSPDLSTGLKIRLYSAAVCSVMVCGCESWFLTEKVLRIINGANSRLLSRFTGKNIQAEVRPASTSLNLNKRIRLQRFRWLGTILRNSWDGATGRRRLIYQAVESQHLHQMKGGILMDAPPCNNVSELIPLANDWEGWRALARRI